MTIDGKFIIPDLVLVGYGRNQLKMRACFKCQARFIPGDDGNFFCDRHEYEVIDTEKEELYKKHLSTVNFEQVVRWEIESISLDKRSRYNYSKVYKRDRYQCQYCGYKPGICPEFIPLSIDHVYPFIRNGSNKLDNLVVACMECNLIASAKLFEDFLDKKAFILDRRDAKGLRRSWFRYVNELELEIFGQK